MAARAQEIKLLMCAHRILEGRRPTHTTLTVITTQRSSHMVNPSISESVKDRPAAINELINGVDRYNPANITILEEYLADQCRHRRYDLEANLAVLKL